MHLKRNDEESKNHPLIRVRFLGEKRFLQMEYAQQYRGRTSHVFSSLFSLI